MIPELPRICNYHEIIRPTLYLPVIKHEFGESLISYQLARMLNLVYTHSFLEFQLYVKYRIIKSYPNLQISAIYLIVISVIGVQEEFQISDIRPY